MIFIRAAVCSPGVLQSTEGKNHSLPRSIYYFLHDSPILIHSPAEKAEYHYYLKIYRPGMWLLFFNQSLETF
jgi:hypothetical protein